MCFDISIAGAGIVGLATAYELLQKKPSLRICVYEKEHSFAMHQTGHNSGVIHSGVYYKTGSLKERNCTRGRTMLLEFCNEHNISYQKKYKLIVATRTDELSKLNDLFLRGQANQIEGISKIVQEEVREIEPNVFALQAIKIPSCYIIDYKQVSFALHQELEKRGVCFSFHEPVLEVRKEDAGCLIVSKTKSQQSKFFINCAGLYSDRLARASKEILDSQIVPFRGEYYTLASNKKDFVKGLIYPVPDPNFPFLGVHLTPMISGHIEAGPNAVLAWAREGYKRSNVSFRDMKELLLFSGFRKMTMNYWRAGMYEMARSLSKKLFLRDLQRLTPSLTEKDLHQGGSGIRAQLVTKEGKLVDDFSFAEKDRILHVLNAPSPAATASFSIGQFLADKILTNLQSRA